MPVIAASLISTYRFSVKIPDVDTIGYFSRCDGLELSFELYEYREGGMNDFVHHLPGGLRYPNLVLTRGLTNEQALLKWFWATHTQAERKEILLTLGDGTVSRSWTFNEAFPVRWTGPQIESDGSAVATETLEIAHSGLKMA
jgi:phage tail-like protein